MSIAKPVTILSAGGRRKSAGSARSTLSSSTPSSSASANSTPSNKKYGKLLISLTAGFILGLLLGVAARALTAADPSVGWFLFGSLVFFCGGACFISAFGKAEREHELRLAACLAACDESAESALRMCGGAELPAVWDSGRGSWRAPGYAPWLRRIK